ncbi:MAG: RluA family pseudouridine synthase [Acidobacteriota bacterium]|jgi:23S rRNA pseudouridine1911/1915/1917 synthase|nr:RluA family pseudouridine synthase [Acidobacteriota bacterium]
MNKNNGFVYRNRIDAPDTGTTLLDFYRIRYPHSTAAEWLERVRDGLVLCNGKSVNPDYRLRSGDQLEWRRTPWQEPGAPQGLDLLLDEAALLVIHKPAGLPVLPGAGFLQNTALFKVRKRFGPDCFPVHRLGRWTSGALVFARNRESARNLGTSMQAGRFEKVYLALAAGSDLPDHFTVRVPIGPVAYDPLGTVFAASSTGRPAESRVDVLRRCEAMNQSLVRIRILTGRPHQIRIHMAAAGYPLAGDPLYAPGGLPREGRALPGDPGYCLHAWKLAFPHPVSRDRVEVECPLPEWAGQLNRD